MPRLDHALVDRATRARDWLFDAAFPLWSEAGRHPDGGFRERLDLQGRPLEDTQSRVRVQARQIYSFALAWQMGWQPGRARACVVEGVEQLWQIGRREDGLFGRWITHGAGLSETTADLYDNAFALLALSQAARAGADLAARAADETARTVTSLLPRPASEGGYFEHLPAPSIRSQNPHMHLLEAFLAHARARADGNSLNRATALAALMASKFLTAEPLQLREVFAADWGATRDDRIETGHQFEWVWLLAHLNASGGAAPRPVRDALYANGNRLTGPNGEIWLAHGLQGQLVNADQRTWGLTEALKAHLAMAEHDRDATGRAILAFDRLWSLHLTPAPDGGWIDRYGPTGSPTCDDIPASTLYHVALAFADLMERAGLLEETGPVL